MTTVPGATEWLPPPGLPVAQVWRGLRNEVLARGYASEGRWWMRWPGVGTFLLDPTRPDTVLVPDRGIERAVLGDAFRRGVTPLVLLQREYEVLHASAVSTSRGVVAFCAASGAGKSTLAAAVARAGCAHWADDFLAFRSEGGCDVCHWFPSAERLDPAALSALSGAGAVNAGLQNSRPRSERLAAVALLVRDASVPPGEARVSRVPQEEAFTAVLPHAHDCHIGGQPRVRRSLERYLDLCARVPVFTLSFRADLSGLGQLAAQVMSWVGSLRT